MRSPGRPPGWRRERLREFWAAIARGVSSQDAAVAVDLSPAVGSRWFRQAGGMPNIGPHPLSGRYLSFTDREEIAVLTARGCGVRKIASQLGRSPSTISHELRRNAATRSGGFGYRATTAQWHADLRARRPKVAKLARNAALRDHVQEGLAGLVTASDGMAIRGPAVPWVGRRHGRRKDWRWASAWSPEQISNRLHVDYPYDG
jgi:transposase